MTIRLNSDWQRKLELKMRRFYGNAFQTFFGDVMEAKYSDDFSRTKPFGRLGDAGCDGFLQSAGTVFSCHGTQNGKSPKVTDLLDKMRKDFEKANSNLSDIMKEWQFVHNYIDGLPTEAIKELNKFRKERPSIAISSFGIARFSEMMATLPESELERLLGPIARQNDFHNLQMSEVKELVDTIVSEIVDYTPKKQTISPVSSLKLDFNEIPEMWASPLRSGRYNEHLIQDYVS